MNGFANWAFKDRPGAYRIVGGLRLLAGWAQTRTGKRETATLADRIRNTDNLFLAIWAPAESSPAAPSTDRWENPVQTTPQPLIETIYPGHALSVVLREIL